MAELDFIERMDLIAERQGGFYYPWVSALGARDGEAAYTELVESHLSENATILDAGCGHGRDMVWFAPKVAKYVGYDLSQGFIRIASETALRQGLGHAELILANSSPASNGGQARIPMPDQSVDMIISRRGPTNWIADARRVARPGSWLIQLNPQPTPTPVWDGMLPKDLRFEPDREMDIRDRIEGLLGAADLEMHSAWSFDVPERLSAADQLYAYLAWSQFHGRGRQPRPFEAVRGELEAVMERCAGPTGLVLRRRRFLWMARVD